MTEPSHLITSDAPYYDLEIHRRMLADTVRVDAFRKAIEASVHPGSVVLDVGAGTGILSLLAVHAGAKKVYAVEPTAIASVARQIVRENGMTERIQVIEAGIEKTALPEPVDVIVFEWMGGFGVDEGMLPLLLLARDRWLKPGGRVIPGSVAMWMAPAYDRALAGERDLWTGARYGVDLRILWRNMVDMWHYGRHHVTVDDCIAPPFRLWDHDAATQSYAASCATMTASHRFTASRRGEMNSLLVWFDSELVPGVRLANGPGDRENHWGPTVFPLDRSHHLEAGDIVEMAFEFQANLSGVHRSGLSVRIGNGAWERHNDHRKAPAKT